MIYMLGAVLCLCGLFIFMKLFSVSTKRTVYTTLAFSVVYGVIATIVCSVVGGGLVFDNLPSTLLALAFAVISIGFVLLGILVVSLGNMSMYSMFTLLGSIVLTFIYGLVFRDEAGSVSIFRWIGIALMLISLFVPLIDERGGEKSKNSGSKKEKILFWSCCLAGFLCNGLAGVVCAVQADVEIAQLVAGQTPVTSIQFCGLYMLIMTVISAVLLGILACFKKTREGVKSCKSIFRVAPLVFSACYGISTAFANVFNIEATKNLPATLTFPFSNGGVIVLTALIGAIFFREKSGPFTKLGLILTTISTVLFVL